MLWPQILRFIKWYKPDRLVIGGDFADFYRVSKYGKSEERKESFQDELDDAKAGVAELRKAVGKKCLIDYLLGNHEERLAAYLDSDATALRSLRCLRLTELLGLDEQNVTLRGRQGFLLRPWFRPKHGDYVGKRSGDSARKEQAQHGASGISGHCHRDGEILTRNDTGIHLWLEAGCACAMDQEYLKGKRPDWQHAITIATLTDTFETSTFERIRIHNQHLTYHGKSFK